MRKIIKVKIHEDPLSEIYQQVDLKFALANKSDEGPRRISDYFKCRDYFSDALLTVYSGILMERKYGFLFDPSKTEEWDITEDSSFLLCVPNKYVEVLEKNIGLISSLEEYYDWKIIELEKVEPEKTGLGLTYYSVVADKRWTTSIFMTSLYTFLIRACCEDNKEDVSDIEKHMEYVSTLPNSSNNRRLASAIVDSKVPLWAILQEHDAIHKDADVVGEVGTEINKETVHNAHDHGGMLRFFEHIISYRKGSKKKAGEDETYFGHKLAWNFFVLDASKEDIAKCT